MCDRKGVIHKGRTDLDQWKSAHAVETDRRTLDEALVGADVFLGLSAAGALKPDMVEEMAKEPIIFAMANPDPEIWPPDAKAVRPDAIIATGRSDFPNQVNNVLGFPFIFRGALDVRATRINEEMKIAAAEALAELAREPVPEEVAAAYGGRTQSFGRDYIIPAPFDPRLMEVVAVGGRGSGGEDRRGAQADRRISTPIARSLRARSEPDRLGAQPRLRSGARRTRSACCSRKARSRTCYAPPSPSRKPATARRCWSGARTPTICCASMGSTIRKDYEVLNSRNSPLVGRAVDFIYAKHQRHGMLRREIERLVNQDRNYFAAAMLALGEADAMITGTTRPFSQSLRQVRMVIDDEPGATPFGVSVVVARHQTVLIADTAVTERPDAEQFAAIALRSAGFARRMGLEPRIAFISYTTFGNPPGSPYRGASRRGEAARRHSSATSNMKARWARTSRSTTRCSGASIRSAACPGPANILVMPGLQSASLSAKLLRELGGESILGPYHPGPRDAGADRADDRDAPPTSSRSPCSPRSAPASAPKRLDPLDAS